MCFSFSNSWSNLLTLWTTKPTGPSKCGFFHETLPLPQSILCCWFCVLGSVRYPRRTLPVLPEACVTPVTRACSSTEYLPLQGGFAVIWSGDYQPTVINLLCSSIVIAQSQSVPVSLSSSYQLRTDGLYLDYGNMNRKSKSSVHTLVSCQFCQFGGFLSLSSL